MGNRIIEAVIRIQNEYRSMLTNYQRLISDDNFIQIVDEISIFWEKNRKVIDAFVDFESKPYSTYVFTAVTRINYDDNECLPFLCLGNKHIFDDPLCSYFDVVKNNGSTTFAKNLRSEIEKTINDNIEIMNNEKFIYLIPLRYLYSDREIVTTKAEEMFLSMFESNLTSMEDYFKFESIEQIYSSLRNEVKDSIAFSKNEDIRRTFFERYNDYKNEYAEKMLGTDNDVALFCMSIMGNISQAIDIVFMADCLKIVPYLRNDIAMRYFLIVYDNVKLWSNTVEEIAFNSVVANVLYNKLKKDEFGDLIKPTNFDLFRIHEFEKKLFDDFKLNKICTVEGNIGKINELVQVNLEKLKLNIT